MIKKYKMTNERDYIPGVCYNRKEERKARMNWPIGMFLLFVAIVVLLQILSANHIWRLLVFFPVAAFAITFQQVYFGFFVAYGSKGLYNFAALGKPSQTTNEGYLQKDRAKVQRMIITGITAGTLVAVLYYFLPV
jgi:hypothetical protein